MEVGPEKQQAWRKRISEVYPMLLMVKAFQWSGDGIILMDFKVGGKLARAVYNPGLCGYSSVLPVCGETRDKARLISGAYH